MSEEISNRELFRKAYTEPAPVAFRTIAGFLIGLACAWWTGGYDLGGYLLFGGISAVGWFALGPVFVLMRQKV